MKNKEIGGYFEFEKYEGKMLHESATKLNLARNCLKYIIISQGITQLYLPRYICDSVINACKELNVEIVFYDIDNDFKPNLTGIKNKIVYVVNYFGFLKNGFLKKISKKNKIIVDNVQAFFQNPVLGLDTIYSCRKFFGVSDGALLCTNSNTKLHLEFDHSGERIEYLIGRLEENAVSYYDSFKKNEINFEKQSVKFMSKFTENTLRSLNYKKIKQKRTKNYKYLNSKLKKINILKCKRIKGPYCYPLMLENAREIREKLISNKIFIPILWPNCLSVEEKNKSSYNFASKILPLPCDQRYTRQDMKIIVNYIKEEIL